MENSETTQDLDKQYSLIEVDEISQSSRIELEILYHDTKWQSLENLEAIILSAVKATFNKVGHEEQKPLLISIVFADDFEVQKLNKSFRNKDKPTNVLSFPTEGYDWQEIETSLSLGDIILAYETVIHEAKNLQMSTLDHVSHLIIHGILHLIGFDHEDDNDAQIMEGLEREILNSIGIFINDTNAA